MDPTRFLARRGTALALAFVSSFACADEAPAARLVVDAPLAAALANGALVLSFHAERASSRASPPGEHLHLALDDAPWHWLHADAGPVVLIGLPPGQHVLSLELADSEHRVLDKRRVEFTVPKG